MGGSDVAVGRCDSNGNIEWLGQYGTSADDLCYHVLIGQSDSIITIGTTAGSFFGANQGGYMMLILYRLPPMATF